MTINFLKETLEAIEQSGHIVDEIVFIGSLETGHSCSWTEFKKLANQDYNSASCVQKVAVDLVIVFSDGQTMWRHDYGGYEGWMYSKPVVFPGANHPIASLFAPKTKAGYLTLDEIADALT